MPTCRLKVLTSRPATLLGHHITLREMLQPLGITPQDLDAAISVNGNLLRLAPPEVARRLREAAEQTGEPPAELLPTLLAPPAARQRPLQRLLGLSAEGARRAVTSAPALAGLGEEQLRERVGALAEMLGTSQQDAVHAFKEAPQALALAPEGDARQPMHQPASNFC